MGWFLLSGGGGIQKQNKADGEEAKIVLLKAMHFKTTHISQDCLFDLYV